MRKTADTAVGNGERRSVNGEKQMDVRRTGICGDTFGMDP